eukprot:m.264911 g.264911  ORF g.264911 m.264911 type:complete len:1797 (+) comp28353_c0_seq1:231-5621(+)
MTFQPQVQQRLVTTKFIFPFVLRVMRLFLLFLVLLSVAHGKRYNCTSSVLDYTNCKYIIIGGGWGAAYYAFRVAVDSKLFNPHEVCLFEGNYRVGGRAWSQTDIPNLSGFVVDLAAYRYDEHGHPLCHHVATRVLELPTKCYSPQPGYCNSLGQLHLFKRVVDFNNAGYASGPEGLICDKFRAAGGRVFLEHRLIAIEDSGVSDAPIKLTFNNSLVLNVKNVMLNTPKTSLKAMKPNLLFDAADEKTKYALNLPVEGKAAKIYLVYNHTNWRRHAELNYGKFADKEDERKEGFPPLQGRLHDYVGNFPHADGVLDGSSGAGAILVYYDFSNFSGPAVDLLRSKWQKDIKSPYFYVANGDERDQGLNQYMHKKFVKTLRQIARKRNVNLTEDDIPNRSEGAVFGVWYAGDDPERALVPHYSFLGAKNHKTEFVVDPNHAIRNKVSKPLENYDIFLANEAYSGGEGWAHPTLIQVERLLWRWFQDKPAWVRDCNDCLTADNGPCDAETPKTETPSITNRCACTACVSERWWQRHINHNVDTEEFIRAEHPRGAVCADSPPFPPADDEVCPQSVSVDNYVVSWDWTEEDELQITVSLPNDEVSNKNVWTGISFSNTTKDADLTVAPHMSNAPYVSKLSMHQCTSGDQTVWSFSRPPFNPVFDPTILQLFSSEDARELADKYHINVTDYKQVSTEAATLAYNMSWGQGYWEDKNVVWAPEKTDLFKLWLDSGKPQSHSQATTENGDDRKTRTVTGPRVNLYGPTTMLVAVNSQRQAISVSANLFCGRKQKPTFYRDIIPMFRVKDRLPMLPFFDLYQCEEVRAHKGAIYEKLMHKTVYNLTGGMPKDITWPLHQLQTFRLWAELDDPPCGTPPECTDDSGRAITFFKDIRSLMRPVDRAAMLLVSPSMDLWDYATVKDNAPQIYRQVASGKMPCYGAPWSSHNVNMFKVWMSCGMRKGKESDQPPTNKVWEQGGLVEAKPTSRRAPDGFWRRNGTEASQVGFSWPFDVANPMYNDPRRRVSGFYRYLVTFKANDRVTFKGIAFRTALQIPVFVAQVPVDFAGDFGLQRWIKFSDSNNAVVTSVFAKPDKEPSTGVATLQSAEHQGSTWRGWNGKYADESQSTGDGKPLSVSIEPLSMDLSDAFFKVTWFANTTGGSSYVKRIGIGYADQSPGAKGRSVFETLVVAWADATGGAQDLPPVALVRYNFFEDVLVKGSAASLQQGLIEDETLSKYKINGRAEILDALVKATHLEQMLMIQYLYARGSLKSPTDYPVGSQERQLLTEWPEVLLEVAIEEMRHLAIANRLLVAVGGVPNFVHPSFPQPWQYFRSDSASRGIPFSLEPFSAPVAHRFVRFEAQGDEDVQDPLVKSHPPAQHQRLLQGNENDDDAARNQHKHPSSEAFFNSVADFYSAVQDALVREGEGILVNKKAVPNLETAQKLIDAVLEQGEGSSSNDPHAHVTIFKKIARQLDESKFNPSRPVVSNPVLRADPNALFSTGSVTSDTTNRCDHPDQHLHDKWDFPPHTTYISKFTDDGLQYETLSTFNLIYTLMLRFMNQLTGHIGNHRELTAISHTAMKTYMYDVLLPLMEATYDVPLNLQDPDGCLLGPGFELPDIANVVLVAENNTVEVAVGLLTEAVEQTKALEALLERKGCSGGATLLCASMRKVRSAADAINQMIAQLEPTGVWERPKVDCQRSKRVSSGPVNAANHPVGTSSKSLYHQGAQLNHDTSSTTTTTITTTIKTTSNATISNTGASDHDSDNSTTLWGVVGALLGCVALVLVVAGALLYKRKADRRSYQRF